ncbi:MAG: hypothetical protein ACRDWD_16660, partial [Acidimicrobiia bacterium]
LWTSQSAVDSSHAIPEKHVDTEVAHRSLGAELFRRDPQAYGRIAGEIVAETKGRPELPASTQRLATEVMYPTLSYLADQPEGQVEVTPFLKGLMRVQGETIAGSYALATSETWESLDSNRFVALMDKALQGRFEGDQWQRILRTTSGLVADLPAYESLGEYLKSQPTYERLASGGVPASG